MSSIKKLINKFWRETHGQEIAEAAFVLPLLFLLVFAILWFARAYSIYTTLTQAANAAAIAGAQSTCATCGNAPMTPLDVQNTVINPILDAAHLDHTKVSITMSPANTLLSCNCPNPNPPLGNGVIVDLRYQFGFGLSNVIPTNLTIRAEGRALEEN
jgi:hypothetical protein